MTNDLSILTSQTVPELWEKRHEIYKDSQFDLSVVQKIDSAGIAFLVQWAKHLPEQKLRLLNADDNAKSLIITFHLEPMFDLM